jgi:hypothetical protein
MPLVAATPLLVAPGDRPLAEYALRVLAQCRFVTKGSFFAALGPAGFSPHQVDDWVRAGLLFEGKIQLDPLATADAVPYLALTRAGARALAGATGVRVEASTPAMLRRPNQKRGHDVCVGELALAVLTLARDDQIDLVGVECDDHRISFSVTLAEPGAAPESLTLRPDAYVLARTSMGPTGLLVEVDRGTVSAKTMARRYAGYLAWQRSGGPDRDFSVKALRVLTVAPSVARLQALHGAALGANRGKPSGFLLFAPQDDLTVSTAERWLGPVARGLGTVPENRIPLLPARQCDVAA